MATADRLYEVACECRDIEERLDRVLRENEDLRADRDALRRGVGEVLIAADDVQRFGGSLAEARLAKHVEELRALVP